MVLNKFYVGCGSNRLGEHLVENDEMQGMGEFTGRLRCVLRAFLLLSLVNHSSDRDLGVTCDVGESEGLSDPNRIIKTKHFHFSIERHPSFGHTSCGSAIRSLPHPHPIL